MGVRSLGWFTRFVQPDQIGIGQFYETVIGLPRIRSFRHAIDWKRQDKDFFWGGECILFETFYNGRATVSKDDADPARAPLVPVFRTSDLTALVDHWRTRGADVALIADVPGGRQAWIRDPAGLLIAIREVDEPTTLHDLEALRRRRRGEAFNPGCAAMPEHLQEIGWVQRRVADVAAQTRFFGGVLGLTLIEEGDDRAIFDLGDNVLLELLAGGTSRPAPAAQMETTGVIIVRVDDMPALREKARAAGHAVVHELYQFPRGTLSYVDDGAGHLIGLSHMTHPSTYIAVHPPVTEDIEADRRWAEALAAQQAQ